MNTDSERQVQAARRRLIESTAAPLVKRLQLMTMAKAPRHTELLDALITASCFTNDVEPIQRVFACWQRWMLVMHNYESFGTYARRNLRTGR